MLIRRPPLCLLMVFVSGCVAMTPPLTQAQLNAIESREVDAGMAETFTAASNALFDAGYTIAMSDRQGGLITGTKAQDNSAARFWVSPMIQDTHFTISIQVREIEPKRCAIRVKTSINGESNTDKTAIDQIWTLMQRQVLMKEPLTTVEQVSPQAAASQGNAPEKTNTTK